MSRIDRRRVLVVSALIIVYALVAGAMMYADMQDAPEELVIDEVPPDPVPVFYYDVSTEDLMPEAQRPIEVPVESTSIDDFELICRLVAAEARGECYEGKKAVAQVVKDRMEHSNTWFGGPSAKGVIYKKGQFASPWKGDLDDYPDIAEAVEAVFSNNERVFEETVLFFYHPKIATRGGMAPIKRYNFVGEIGCHHFHGDEKIK